MTLAPATGLPLAFRISIVIAAAMRGQEVPQTAAQYGAFAYPDARGTRLLAPSSLPQPSSFHTALCTGRRFSVRFERHQAGRAGNDGRATSANFDKLAGNVFTVLDGSIAATAVCLLAADSLLASAALLPAQSPAAPGICSLDVRSRLESSRHRRVANCWPIASVAAGRSIVLAEFARQDRDALASLALLDNGRTIFADYPAVFRGEGQDLWRVDDGGILSAEGMEILFLLQRDSSYVLGVNWLASEGASLALFVSKGSDNFVQVIKDYWYRAPQ